LQYEIISDCVWFLKYAACHGFSKKELKEKEKK
jgi:hypothetical protein